MPPTSCLLPACFHKCKARPHSVNSVYTGRTGWKPKLYIRHQPYLQSAEYGLSDLANSKSSTERVNTVQTIGFGRPELGFFCVFVRILCTSAYWDNSNLSTKKALSYKTQPLPRAWDLFAFSIFGHTYGLEASQQ